MANPYWFSRIAKEGRAQGFRMGGILGHPTAVQAMQWFRDRAAKVRAVDVKRITEDTPSRMQVRLTPESVGQMYMFFYYAKHRETLPYWDSFPIIFPMQFYGDSTLDINLHYLPPLLRAQLMDQLYTLAVTENDKIKRLNMSYQILRGAERFGAFKPCIKKHLFSHVRSRYFWVRPSEWDAAMMLPTARWQKATAQQVWGDSERMIG
jgi:hypothetical protein